MESRTSGAGTKDSSQNQIKDSNLSGDPGYFYDPHVVAGQSGEIKLTPGIEARCRCGGRPPYLAFDSPEAEPTWCVCRPYRSKIRHINRLIRESGIPARFQYKYVNDLLEIDPAGRPIPGVNLLKGRVSTLVDRYSERRRLKDGPPSPARGLFLWGAPGNGKTLLACIALNELMFNCALPGKFIGLSRKFFQTLRHTFDESSPTRGQAIPILETLSSVPFLVIDDLGVQRDTDWEVEMLYNLVDARYTEHLLTFITTNKNVEDLKGLAGGRIYSRFLEMCYIIHVQSPDYRQHAQKF